MNAAYAGRYDPSKHFNVNDWNADNGNDNVGAVPAVVSRIKVKFEFAWWILSILQASCLFLEVVFANQGNFYCLRLVYLWLALKEFLINLTCY